MVGDRTDSAICSTATMKSSKLSISAKIASKTRESPKLYSTAGIVAIGENGVSRCDPEPDLDLQNQESAALELESVQSLRKPKSTSIMVIGRSPTSVSKQNYSISSRNMCGTDAVGIKHEDGVTCVLCACSTDETFDIYSEITSNNVTLCSYIYKIANLKLEHRSCSKYTCRSCYDLLNIIERAELEYLQHRDLLLDIISQNPTLADLGDSNTSDIKSPCTISVESFKVESCKIDHRVSSEDDEPLACLKASRTSTTNTSDIPEECNILSDNRQFSSDDDFTWKFESGEEHCNPKKKKRKHIKNEKVHHKDCDRVMTIKSFKEKGPRLQKKKLKKYNKLIKMEKQYCDNATSDTAGVNADLKCDKCNRVFKKRCYLERHSHCKKPYICEVCGKGFKSPKLCNAHVLMHRGIADYKCVPCNKLFPTKVAFLRHDKIHNGIPCNQCDLCGKSFIHQSSLRMHKLAHAGVRKYTCDVCGLALLSNSMLTRHKLVHTGEKKYACDICGKKFARNSNMHTHMKTHMKDKPRPPTPPHVPGKRKKVFRCEMCPDRFDRLFKLEIHLVDDHKVVLKKGRPKPRNTMKKLQRAQQAAASVVNSIATAMAAKRAADLFTSNKPPVDVKESVSKQNQKMNEDANTDSHIFKSSPPHQSMSPGAVYMSPPPHTAYSQESSESLRMEYQDHQHVIRTTGVMMPALAFNMGAQYLSRISDYSQN